MEFYVKSVKSAFDMLFRRKIFLPFSPDSHVS